ncbi:protein IcmD (DotP) [Legionella erythra]|uniref:Protein IcmD (DotP) n=2 Tax=Legionella erythra TaxID=448 RepID=A0A0W0TV94_LEGER|nr:protein IcmD (DotP) [Legionella erythra]
MNTPAKRNSYMNYAVMAAVFLCLGIVTDAAAAASQSIGGMASTIYGSFGQLAKLITAGSYLAGLGFSVGAIMKFKQHKDNPTQIPIGTPIALVFIAAALLFLPTILGVAGVTMFGGSGGTTAGPTGTVFTSSGG